MLWPNPSRCGFCGLKINNCRTNVPFKSESSICCIMRLSVKIQVFFRYCCRRFGAISVIVHVHLFLCHREFKNSVWNLSHYIRAHFTEFDNVCVRVRVYFCHVQLVCRCGSLMEKFRFVASALYLILLIAHLIHTDYTAPMFSDNLHETTQSTRTILLLFHTFSMISWLAERSIFLSLSIFSDCQLYGLPLTVQIGKSS